MRRFLPAAVITTVFIILAFLGQSLEYSLAGREGKKMSSELNHLPTQERRERIDSVKQFRAENPGRVPLGPFDDSDFARHWRSGLWVEAADVIYPEWLEKEFDDSGRILLGPPEEPRTNRFVSVVSVVVIAFSFIALAIIGLAIESRNSSRSPSPPLGTKTNSRLV